MGANAFQNSALISKEFLVRLKNTFAFTMSANRQYSSLFQGKGTKPGTTVDIRRPVYLSGGRGQEIKPEGIKDNLVPLTIKDQYHQAVAISAQEEALNMVSYSKQVIQPAVDIIVNMIDLDGQALVDEVPRFVGSPGVNPALNQLYIDAGVQLDNEAVPANDMVRFAMLNPQQSGGILGTQATQFNPSKDVSEQNRTGNMGMAWGFNFGKSQNIAQHTAGEFGTTAGQVLVDGEVLEGATKVHVDKLENKNGWGRKGDKFQITGTGAVNPSSKNPTGENRFFTLTADVDASGNEADLPCYPAHPGDRAERDRLGAPGRQRDRHVLGPGARRNRSPECWEDVPGRRGLPQGLHHVRHGGPLRPPRCRDGLQGVLRGHPAQRAAYPFLGRAHGPAHRPVRRAGELEGRAAGDGRRDSGRVLQLTPQDRTEEEYQQWQSSTTPRSPLAWTGRLRG